jgi:hypothetical protein
MAALNCQRLLQRRRVFFKSGPAAIASLTLIAMSITGASTGRATASTPSFRLEVPASQSVKSTLTRLFLTAEKRSQTLTPSAQVYLVTSYDYVGSDGKTRAGPHFPNPLVVNGPAHKSWAYAIFDPVVHSKLHDQVALQDGNNVVLFVADPAWHLIRIGLGWPECKTSVLVKVAPAPVVGLWIERHCQ